MKNKEAVEKEFEAARKRNAARLAEKKTVETASKDVDEKPKAVKHSDHPSVFVGDDEMKPPVGEGDWWYKQDKILNEPSHAVWVKAVPRKRAQRETGEFIAVRHRKRIWTNIVVVLGNSRLAKRYFHLSWSSKAERFNYCATAVLFEEMYPEICEHVVRRLMEKTPTHVERSYAEQQRIWSSRKARRDSGN
jgi:hypothetical protein